VRCHARQHSKTEQDESAWHARLGTAQLNTRFTGSHSSLLWKCCAYHSVTQIYYKLNTTNTHLVLHQTNFYNNHNNKGVSHTSPQPSPRKRVHRHTYPGKADSQINPARLLSLTGADLPGSPVIQCRPWL